MSVKSFYGKRTQHRFLSDAVNKIQDDDLGLTNVVIIKMPKGAQDNDLENEDNEILNTTELPEEIAGEVEVFNIRNNEIERMTSDGKDSNVEPPTAKKRKKNAKKSKIKTKWQKQYIQTQTFSNFDRDKNAQAIFLENPELVELTMWILFEKVVSTLIKLFLHETNQYANRNKNKLQIKVTLEGLSNFSVKL